MSNKIKRNRIYIIGAGIAGMSIAKEIQGKRIFGKVVAFLDDDPEKIGKTINNIPIVGPLHSVVDILKTTPADEAIIAVPSATREQLKAIFTTLKKADFTKIRIIPRISQILEGDAHLVQTRDINPEDLLSRTPVKVCLKESLAYLRGKRVLITGAGGSIGSELSRQLLSGGAARLYIFGHGENSLYEIEKELKILQEGGVGEKATIVPIIGELQDRDYMFYLLERLKADVIFHAAAHKHVPLLEENCVEAIKNNVFGTKNIVDAALQFKTERFVFVSTDKAVDPISIYGASKYIAEELVLEAQSNSRKAHYMVVRFGNVLGSRGSILPLFQSQISRGGPVTLTHPEAKRFFMTIPEASSLVLKAGGTGLGGELYILDMGEPVYIQELLKQLIRFYGYEPELDIPIVTVGLRPGEKLIEKLYSDHEKPVPTEYPKILKVTQRKSLQGKLADIILRLRPICYLTSGKSDLFRNSTELQSIINEYIPSIKAIPHEKPK
ncbi:MAG: polysaccharide biosynthesis protein [Spirochaetales bacterium]|nr:polysaccharide biosynthesis protein [Spirochaetales bacterium]